MVNMQEVKELLKAISDRLTHIDKSLVNSVSYKVHFTSIAILTVLLLIAYFKSLGISRISILGKEIKVQELGEQWHEKERKTN